MRGLSSLIVPNAVVAVFVVSATASVAIGQARAEDCLAAPNASSPQGQHWYYRVDRASGRHCWYLHTALGRAHHAHRASVLAHARIEHSAAAASQPAAAAPVPAAAPPVPPAYAPVPFAAVTMPGADDSITAANPPPEAASAQAADNTPSLPDTGVLTVKTIPVRPPGAPAETRPRHHASSASISESSARAYTAAPPNPSGSTTFFFLVFGLGLVTFLGAIVIKHFVPQAGRFSRTPRGDARMAGRAIPERPWRFADSPDLAMRDPECDAANQTLNDLRRWERATRRSRTEHA